MEPGLSGEIAEAASMSKIRDIDVEPGLRVGSRRGLWGVAKGRGVATTTVPVPPLLLFFFIIIVFYGGANPHSLVLLHARLHDCYFHLYPTLMGPIDRKIGSLGH
jgi:hypothetical protein